MTFKRQELCEGPRALDGILIVELGLRIGAAVSGSLLAQLGATVVTVEEPNPNFEGKWKFREQLSAGKMSCCLDPKDIPFLAELITAADVVILSSDVQGRSFGEIETLPRQIVCDVTAFGATGPMSGLPLTDIEIQALTGIFETTGMANGLPVAIPVPLIEYLAGMNAAGAIMAALRVFSQSGVGQRIDIALYDSAFAATSSFLARLLVTSGTKDVGRLGNRHALSSPWNVYRAADGWVQICTGSDDQWSRLCEAMQRADLVKHGHFMRSADRVTHNVEVDEAVQAWVSTQTVAGCVNRLSLANVPGGAIVPIEAYPREPNLDHRGMIRRLQTGAFTPASPFRMSRTPGRPLLNISAAGADRNAVAALIGERDRATTRRRAGPAPSEMPLEGISVLEIGHYTTAPASARTLAALGADVIKIEPPEGEAARAWPPLDRGQSTFYTLTNSDKRSIVIDLGSTEGHAHLRALIAESDVLIENMKPGALAKRGFSVTDIECMNPRLVYCAISGFGADSLYPGRPAFDTVVQGMSGLMNFIRSEDGTPLKTGISVADVLGAALAVVAVFAALAYRDRSGQGQFIDLSMQDIMAWSTQVAWNGVDFAPAATVLRCADGYVACHGYVFADFFQDDLSVLSRSETVALLGKRGRRAVGLLRPVEVLDAEQTLARGLHFRVSDERGDWPALAIPMRLSATPPRITRPSPPLGRDTSAVLAGLKAHSELTRTGGGTLKSAPKQASF